MLASDFLVDIGPGAGEFGGEIIAYGTPKEVPNICCRITTRGSTNSILSDLNYFIEIINIFNFFA